MLTRVGILLLFKAEERRADRPRRIYLLVRWRTLGLPPFGRCESCRCARGCAGTRVPGFGSVGRRPTGGTAGSRSSSVFNSLRSARFVSHRGRTVVQPHPLPPRVRVLAASLPVLAHVHRGLLRPSLATHFLNKPLTGHVTRPNCGRIKRLVW